MRVTEAASAALEMHQHQAAIYYGAQSLPAVQAALLRRIEAKQQQYQQQQQQQQKRSDPPTTTDSLVDRLKWLTTTDDDDQDERSAAGATDVVREAADGISDPEMSQQMAAAAAAAVPVGVNQLHQQQTTAEEETTTIAAAASTSASASTLASASNPPAKPPKPSGAEKSTYRKLNELFFRSKSKDKNKESSSSNNNSQQPTSPNEWKSASVMALNRSFSPPPPAEVEPSKMRPSGSLKKGLPNHLHHHHHHHLIHLVGLPESSSAPGAPASELLGRIPNVVPTVDHVYRAAVDLVTRNEAYGSQTYGLDDIDAALRQAGHHLHPSAAGVIVGDDLSGRDDVASSGGGSRSSGSSGDSGLGSHETSLASGSDVAEATGTTMAGPSAAAAANDELQAFVRQDATQSRIDRIKKRYSAALEDEAEDYGFLRRPSVRGIKTRFGSTSEIMQQMQAQLAPPAGTTVVVSSSSSANNSSSSSGTPNATWSYLDAGSMQAQALLDPRDKRRSALVMVSSSNNGSGGGNGAVMSNSVHLPALPEDAYFQIQPGATSATVRPGQHSLISRPSSVMNIYGSTGDLYQHLRAPRPVVMQPMMQQQQRMLHAASSSSSSSSASPSVGLPPSYTMTMQQQQQQQQQHILERTSSVSSALDGGSSTSSVIYGTIRRQPMMMPPMYNPQQQQHPVESLSSPTRGDYPPGIAMMAQQQPLRMTMSTPVSTTAVGATGAYLPGSNQPPPPRPINNQLVNPTSHGVYAGASSAGGPIGYIPVQDYHHQYATLPAKRQSPYGVTSQQQHQHQMMLDPARYRQVLPAAPMPSSLHQQQQQQQQPVHHLRPASAMMMHDPAAAAIRQSAPTPLPPAPLKDEREGPEGASSSPGLNHHDVSM